MARKRGRDWFHEQVYDLVRAVPPGWVTTYGRIANELGPGVCARGVSNALAELPVETTVPHHRVVSAKGEALCPRGKGTPEEQRARLEAEGVQFNPRGRIDLDRFLWHP